MPPPPLPRLDAWSPHATAAGVFPPADCDRIVALRQDLETKAAGTLDDHEGTTPGTGGAVGPAGQYRKSRVAWLRPGSDNEWVFSRAFEVVRQVNDQCFKMELAGFTEPLQVAEYSESQYYDWHLDIGRGPHSIRKLSFIVQLSDPTTYEGGAVELLCAREAAAIPRDQGAMTVFPSYLLHRVCAVTAGTRHSLVGWIGGPHYR